MPSPFPGMDPFIEGQRCSGFHLQLMSEIRRALVPHLRPRYVIQLEEYEYVEHHPAEPLAGIRSDTVGMAVAVGVEPVTMAIAMPKRERHRWFEIRFRETGDLVTIIEVLSPANKRKGSSTREEYLTKRGQVLLSGVHLVELDLLRGGERLPMVKPLPAADYYAVVSRAPERPLADVWPIPLHAVLPVIQVPLAAGDAEVPLDLQAVFTAVYDAAGYDYATDYTAEPVPPLDETALAWVKEVLEARNQAQAGD